MLCESTVPGKAVQCSTSEARKSEEDSRHFNAKVPRVSGRGVQITWQHHYIRTSLSPTHWSGDWTLTRQGLIFSSPPRFRPSLRASVPHKKVKQK